MMKFAVVAIITILLVLTVSGCSIGKSINGSRTTDSSIPDQENTILDFVKELNTQDDVYESWQGITPQKAYELYDDDFSNVVATLYYMRTDENAVGGYIIIDTKSVILEFSLGEPIYDVYRDTDIINRLGNKIAYRVSKEKLTGN